MPQNTTPTIPRGPRPQRTVMMRENRRPSPRPRSGTSTRMATPSGELEHQLQGGDGTHIAGDKRESISISLLVNNKGVSFSIAFGQRSLTRTQRSSDKQDIDERRASLSLIPTKQAMRPVEQAIIRQRCQKETVHLKINGAHSSGTLLRA